MNGRPRFVKPNFHVALIALAIIAGSLLTVAGGDGIPGDVDRDKEHDRVRGLEKEPDIRIIPPPEPPEEPPEPEKDPDEPEPEPPVSGVEKERREEANPPMVTARRGQDRLFEIPYAAETLGGERLRSEKAVRYLPDAFREMPGVHVQKTGHGQGSPYIRGFTAFRTLLLVDGIRVNHSVMREGPNQYWATVDPLIIDTLEVVKGPGSVLYGSDAIGGTVNALTRSPSLSASESWLHKRRLYYRYASAEHSHAGRGEIEAGYGGWIGTLGGFTYRGLDDLTAGRASGLLPNTGFDEYAGDAKVIARAREDLELTLAFQRHQQWDAPRTHSTIFSKSFAGTTAGSDLRRDLDQRRTLVYGRASWQPSGDIVTEARLTLSYQFHEEREHRIRGDGRQVVQGFDHGVLGVDLEFDSPSPVGELTYGVEYYRDHVDSFRDDYAVDGTLTRRPRGPVADDASYDLLGVYIQDVFKPLERVEITAGGRFTFAAADAHVVDPSPGPGPSIGPVSDEYASAVGSLRALWSITDDGNIFGGVSQGFRAPNLSDLTRFDAARSDEIEVPSPDLDPENFIPFEIGGRWRISDLQLEAAYHYTLIDGMITRFPTGSTVDGLTEVTKANVGDGFVHGVEAGARWEFLRTRSSGTVSAFGNFTWMEGEADTIVGGAPVRQPISRIQPAYSVLGLRWDSPQRRWWVEATVTISDNQDRLSDRDRADTRRIPPGGTPGYTIYSIRGGGEIRDGLTVFAAVENITDKDYRLHGSGQNEAGTNAVIGVDWSF